MLHNLRNSSTVMVIALLALLSATSSVARAAPQQPTFSTTVDEGVQTFETMPGIVTPSGIPGGPGPVILSTQSSLPATSTSPGTFSVITNSTSMTQTAASTTTGAPSAATKSLTFSSIFIPLALFVISTVPQLY